MYNMAIRANFRERPIMLLLPKVFQVPYSKLRCLIGLSIHGPVEQRGRPVLRAHTRNGKLDQ